MPFTQKNSYDGVISEEQPRSSSVLRLKYSDDDVTYTEPLSPLHAHFCSLFPVGLGAKVSLDSLLLDDSFSFI